MISVAFVLWILAGASLKVVQKLSRSHDFGSFCFVDTRWRESQSSPKAVAIASLLPQESVNRQDEWLVKQGA
jgi:hypothetical protein